MPTRGCNFCLIQAPKVLYLRYEHRVSLKMTLFFFDRCKTFFLLLCRSSWGQFRNSRAPIQ
jgi:hypothetical protein